MQMFKKKGFVLLCCLLHGTFPLKGQGKIDFARDVRPIFNAHCTACHGGVKEAGEISFIYRQKALGKGESGKYAVVPGKPDESEVMVRILSKDEDEVMPKPEHGPRLQEKEIATLRQWILEGAEWGEHWAFVPPKEHVLPAVAAKDWPRYAMDHFVLGKLEANGLKPEGEANPEQWLRRASFDLIGLPPSVEDIDAFVADYQKDAEKAIHEATARLLDSPRFGERWASVWMDLARYADSGGYADDNRREVWKYRDWLIDAFNRDLPFDQFTIEQVAGDLLPNATMEQKIATTFSRLSQVNNEGGTDDEEFRVTAVIDRVNTTWETWMGLSFGCVQCHSHPYDPLEHKEYYRFMEFFNQSVDSDLKEDHPVIPIPLAKNQYDEANQLLNQRKEAKEALFSLRKKIDEQTRWAGVNMIEARADKAKLTLVEKDGVAEFYADANVQAGADYQITVTTELPTVSALRVEVLPLDEEKAKHTAEWGFILNQLKIEAIASDGSVTSVPLREVISDEADPFHDPNLSLKGSNMGWSAYAKMHRKHHATFVFEKPWSVTEGMKFVVSIKNGPSYLYSAPLVIKRGRIFMTEHSQWVTQCDDAVVLELKKKIMECTEALKKIPSTPQPIMAELPSANLRSTHLFRRGNWLDKTEYIAEGNTPQLFPMLKKPEGKKASRLDLARWIAGAENPLTARVAVNRLWLELFGTGIVPTPEDFGSAGEPPTNLELLDHLALRFIHQHKWSLKEMLREIATSRTYRQDHRVTKEKIEADPGNRLLSRGPRQRLTAEMVRDHSLTAAGLITHQLGGPPVYPPLPPGVWKPFTPDEWKTAPEGDPQRYRRSVYVYFKRSIVYPLFGSFDVSARDISAKRRLVSNTPIQALTTLNDVAFDEAAKALAKRMQEADAADLSKQISLGYRLVTSTAIKQDRLKELQDLYGSLVSEHKSAPLDALATVASVILNLDEALTR